MKTIALFVWLIKAHVKVILLHNILNLFVCSIILTFSIILNAYNCFDEYILIVTFLVAFNFYTIFQASFDVLAWKTCCNIESLTQRKMSTFVWPCLYSHATCFGTQRWELQSNPIYYAPKATIHYFR